MKSRRFVIKAIDQRPGIVLIEAETGNEYLCKGKALPLGHPSANGKQIKIQMKPPKWGPNPDYKPERKKKKKAENQTKATPKQKKDKPKEKENGMKDRGLTELDRSKYEYPGFIASAGARVERFRGDTFVQAGGKWYNCHPATGQMYRKDLEKNEDVPYGYPMRYEVSDYELPEHLKEEKKEEPKAEEKPKGEPLPEAARKVLTKLQFSYMTNRVPLERAKLSAKNLSKLEALGLVAILDNAVYATDKGKNALQEGVLNPESGDEAKGDLDRATEQVNKLVADGFKRDHRSKMPIVWHNPETGEQVEFKPERVVEPGMGGSGGEHYHYRGIYFSRSRKGEPYRGRVAWYSPSKGNSLAEIADRLDDLLDVHAKSQREKAAKEALKQKAATKAGDSE